MKTIFSFLIIILLFISISCQKENADPLGFTIYTIDSGSNQPHSSEMPFVYFFKDEVKYNIKLDTSILCSFSTSFCSKIVGLEESGDNSIRIGFYTYNDSLRIVGYAHNSGTFKVSSEGITYTREKLLSLLNDSIYQNHGFDAKIKVYQDEYVIDFDGHQIKMYRTCSDSANGYKRRMYPYLGGNNIKAPKNIYFWIRYL